MIRGFPAWGRLRRVTTSGAYVPEIDGLRFIAIALVVMFHVVANLKAKDPQTWQPADSPLAVVLRRGDIGVPLFFVISGFILAVPFARQHAWGGPVVSLRRYYLRRVTRLEPPYVLVLTVLFLELVLRGGEPGVAGPLWQHLLASLTYTHSAVYGEQSLIARVAWSLEVEIQFYLLAPLLTRVFRLRRRALRRGVLVAAVGLAGGLAVWAGGAGDRAALSILAFGQYFLAGFLLAELFLGGVLDRPRSRWWDLVSVLGWPALFVLVGVRDLDAPAPHLLGTLALPLLMVGLYAAAFRGPRTNRALTAAAVTAIGGMCYSIYLVHNTVLGASLVLTGRLTPSGPWDARILAQIALSAVPVLAVSAAVFVLVERPCMRPDWPARLLAAVRGGLHAARRDDPDAAPEPVTRDVLGTGR